MNALLAATSVLAAAPKAEDAPLIDMSPSLVLVLAVGAFVTAGVYLLLERSLTRVLLGFILIGNGVNLMFLIAGGRAGGAPIVGETPNNEMSDPLPQAMVLTAIVITLGLTAFVLAMAHRSWQLLGHDEVQDDLEDRRIARIAARNAPTVDGSDTSDDTLAVNTDDDAAEVRDETSDLTEHDSEFLAAQSAEYYRAMAAKAEDEETKARHLSSAEHFEERERHLRAARAGNEAAGAKPSQSSEIKKPQTEQDEQDKGGRDD